MPANPQAYFDGLMLGIAHYGSSSGMNFNSATAYWARLLYIPETKYLSKIHILATKQGGNGGTLGFNVQTADATPSSNQFPSGSTASGFTEQDVAISKAGASLYTITLGTPFEVSAYTPLWGVIRNKAGAPATDYFRLEYTATTGFPLPASAGVGFFGKVLTTTSGSWANSANDAAYQRVVFEFTDGSLLGHPYANSGGLSSASHKVYGSNYKAKLTFRPLIPFLFSGLAVPLARTGTPSAFLTGVLKDNDGNTLQTANFAWGAHPAYNTSTRIQSFPFIPRWLSPNQDYSVEFNCTGGGGDSSNYWALGGLSCDPNPATLNQNNLRRQIQLRSYEMTDGANWVENATYQPSVMLYGQAAGDFEGHGDVLLDASVRDGSSGASLRLRAFSEVFDFVYIRRFIAGGGEANYSVKMRRASTAVPAVQQVKLYVSGSQIGSPLTADSAADDAFATYSTSFSALAAGAVVEIQCSTRLSPGAAEGQGYAWFDTEVFS